jgi:biotin carboxyl carrier protein
MMRWWVDRGDAPSELTAERREGRVAVTLDGVSHEVELLPMGPGLYGLFCPDGRTFAVAAQRLGKDHWRLLLAQRQFEVRLRQPLEREVAGHAGGGHDAGEVRAPIPGKVVGVVVNVGEAVSPGQPLLVLEAMKMQNELRAERGGTVAAVHVAAGATVESGQLLLTIE